MHSVEAQILPAAEAGYHAIQAAANESPRLLSVQVAAEPLPDRVVRTVAAVAHTAGIVGDDPFPSIDHLLACAWDTLPLPHEFTDRGLTARELLLR